MDVEVENGPDENVRTMLLFIAFLTPSQLPIGAIVGIVIAAIVGTLLLIVAVYYVVAKHHKPDYI